MRVWALLSLLAAGVFALACGKDEARPPIIGNEPAGPPSVGVGSNSPSTSTDASVAASSIATAPAPIRGLALTAADVYFVYAAPTDAGAADGGVASAGVLARVPRAGGSSRVVVTGGEAPRSLAFSGTSFLWIDDGPGSSSLVEVTETVARPIATGLSATAAFAPGPTGVVIANGAIGAVNLDLVPAASDGGALVPVGSVQGNVSPVRIAVAGTTAFVLVAEAPGASLYRVPLSGGVPENVWSSAGGTPRDLAVVEGRAFVALENGTDGSILSIALPSGSPTPLVTPVDRPLQIVVEGTDLFYTTAGGLLVRVPVAGGEATILATDLGSPSALAVGDAAYIATGNQIARFAR